LESIIKNSFAEDDVKREATDFLSKVSEEVKEFDDGKAKLARDPNREFPNIREEASFKRKFWAKFNRYLQPDDVKLPVLIKPNADDVKVVIDGTRNDVVSQSTANDAANTFRLSYTPPHQFEFTKPGYRKVT